MAKVDDGIDAAMTVWIEQQPVFLVVDVARVSEAPHGADHASATVEPAHRVGDVPPAVPV